jgi:hypothetical protein
MFEKRDWYPLIASLLGEALFLLFLQYAKIPARRRGK